MQASLRLLVRTCAHRDKHTGRNTESLGWCHCLLRASSFFVILPAQPCALSRLLKAGEQLSRPLHIALGKNANAHRLDENLSN